MAVEAAEVFGLRQVAVVTVLGGRFLGAERFETRLRGVLGLALLGRLLLGGLQVFACLGEGLQLFLVALEIREELLERFDFGLRLLRFSEAQAGLLDGLERDLQVLFCGLMLRLRRAGVLRYVLQLPVQVFEGLCALRCFELRAAQVHLRRLLVQFGHCLLAGLERAELLLQFFCLRVCFLCCALDLLQALELWLRLVDRHGGRVARRVEFFPGLTAPALE